MIEDARADAERAEEHMEAQLAEVREQMGALTQALEQERERRRQVETTLDAVLRERVPEGVPGRSCC